MKLLALIVAVVVLLIAIVIIVGASLPKHHVAARSVLLPASPAEVYGVIADVERAPSWREDVQRVEVLGARQFREHGAHGAVTYEIVESVPGRRRVTRIVERDLGYSGAWTYSFAAHGAGTELTITEQGEVSNVLFRFMSRFVFGHTKTIDTYLAFLSRRIGTRVRP
jgi:hypothetical protein